MILRDNHNWLLVVEIQGIVAKTYACCGGILTYKLLLLFLFGLLDLCLLLPHLVQLQPMLTLLSLHLNLVVHELTIWTVFGLRFHLGGPLSDLMNHFWTSQLRFNLTIIVY